MLVPHSQIVTLYSKFLHGTALQCALIVKETIEKFTSIRKFGGIGEGGANILAMHSLGKPVHYFPIQNLYKNIVLK